MKVVDAMIIDQTPLADKYAKKYAKNINKFYRQRFPAGVRAGILS